MDSKKTTASGKPRQRAAMACNACRTKRRRCDGTKPQCGPCRDHAVQCEYSTQESNRKPPSKRYVVALQERIQLLERQLKQDHHKLKMEDEQSEAEVWDEAHSASEDEIDSDKGSIDERLPIKELASKMGSLNIGEDGHARYFGSRSNFSLLRSKLTERPSVSTKEVRTRAANAVQRLGLHVSLSQELRDHLLELYWRWQNPWQYVVVKDLFMRDLEAGIDSRYAPPVVVLSILALASRYSDRPELRSDPGDPNTAGNALAEQAKTLLLFESEAPTVTAVQAAALLALRETATDKESLGWLYCGMASRMAFSLGLHLDHSRWCKAGHITEEEAEVRRVAWWACYVLDKLFNIGLGRPSTIQEHEVTANLPSTKQKYELESWQAADDTEPGKAFDHCHVISNCQATCRLFQITTAALDRIYRTNAPAETSQVFDLVAKTHVKLLRFYTHLPSRLRLPAAFSRPALPHVYQLHLQYHVTVILLHRPVIGMNGDATFSNLERNVTYDAHLEECSKSATSIVNIFKAYRDHYTLRHIPISAVHCAFTASIIFLVEATTLEVKDLTRTLRSLRLLTTALEEMSIAWGWSRRALKALRQLAKEWSAGEKVESAVGAVSQSPPAKELGLPDMPTTSDMDLSQQAVPDMYRWPPPHIPLDNAEMFDWTGLGFWDMEAIEPMEDLLLPSFNNS